MVYLAHDLKTPLTSVIGYLTLLQEEPKLGENPSEELLILLLPWAKLSQVLQL